MNRPIKSVMLPNTTPGLLYKVGCVCPQTDKVISKIYHVAQESQDGNIYSSYDGRDANGDIIFIIENCPVIVIYE